MLLSDGVVFSSSVVFVGLMVVTSTQTDMQCLQCFDAVVWAAGRASSL